LGCATEIYFGNAKLGPYYENCPTVGQINEPITPINGFGRDNPLSDMDNKIQSI
jgi:hypothetical protein